MKILVAIPCMDMVQTDFMSSCLQMHKVGDVEFAMAKCSLVYDARNTLAKMAIERDFDRVLWLDSDMTFEANLLEKLGEHLDRGREMVCGLYVTRKPPVTPAIYKALQLIPDDPVPSPNADAYYDYPEGGAFPIGGCGFGCVLMTGALLRRVADMYGPPFTPAWGFGEDLSFCLRVGQLGETMWCDSSVALGHVGSAIYTAETYKLSRANE